MIALALGELRALAGLLEAVLLTLDGAGVTGEVAGLLEVFTVLAGVEKGAGDAEAQRAGLAGDAAAIAVGEDVKALGGLGQAQRGDGVVDELLTAEVVDGLAAVHDDLAGAGDKTNAGDGLLAAAGAGVDNGVLSHIPGRRPHRSGICT